LRNKQTNERRRKRITSSAKANGMKSAIVVEKMEKQQVEKQQTAVYTHGVRIYVARSEIDQSRTGKCR